MGRWVGGWVGGAWTEENGDDGGSADLVVRWGGLRVGVLGRCGGWAGGGAGAM